MDGAEAREPMVLVVIGGDPGAPARLPRRIHPGAVVVAVDAGLDLVVARGLPAHHVVGDLDSVSAAALATAEAAGAIVHRHPADKDATDFELALELAARDLAPRLGVDRLLVVGPGGGRFDLLVGDVLALCGPLTAGLRSAARFGAADVHVVRPGQPARVAGEPGDQVSLLPIHGAVRGVSTTGLRWPLAGADLAPGTTRGLSNELLAPEATVAVADGVVAVVIPGTRALPVPPRTTPYDPTPTLPGGPR